MSESIVRIADLDQADTPDVVDGVSFEMETAGGDSKKVQLYQIRTGLGGVVATGDVTFSGVLGSSFATQIANNVVGLPELTHGTANTLVGMDGTGTPAEIAAGSGITISGGVITASAPAASAPRATLFLAEEYAL